MSRNYETHGYYTVDNFKAPHDESQYGVKVRDTGRWVSGPMTYLEADNIRNWMNAAFREGLRQGESERKALAAMIDKTPWLVEHIAADNVVAAFEQPDIARGWMDRGHEIGHWHMRELRLIDARTHKPTP